MGKYVIKIERNTYLKKSIFGSWRKVPYYAASYFKNTYQANKYIHKMGLAKMYSAQVVRGS